MAQMNLLLFEPSGLGRESVGGFKGLPIEIKSSFEAIKVPGYRDVVPLSRTDQALFARVVRTAIDATFQMACS